MLDTLPCLLPGVLVVFLSFNAGGYFPRHVAIGLLIVTAVLVVRALASATPLSGFSLPAVAAAALLALLAAWAYASGTWSDSPIRALVEFDRVLLYFAALVLFASMPRTQDRVRWLVRGVLAGAFIVCACAFVTRALPELWPVASDVAADRLSYPLTYWNALGLLATSGLLLAFGTTSDLREHAAVRVAAAGTIPVFAATLLFTFSRASMALAAGGIVLVILLMRSAGVLSGLLILPAETRRQGLDAEVGAQGEPVPRRPRKRLGL